MERYTELTDRDLRSLARDRVREEEERTQQLSHDIAVLQRQRDELIRHRMDERIGLIDRAQVSRTAVPSDSVSMITIDE